MIYFYPKEITNEIPKTPSFSILGIEYYGYLVPSINIVIPTPGPNGTYYLAEMDGNVYQSNGTILIPINVNKTEWYFYDKYDSMIYLIKSLMVEAIDKNYNPNDQILDYKSNQVLKFDGLCFIIQN